jgi:hypothetical protein
LTSFLDTPRAKQRDNPRPFFRFYPLVSREDDVYKKVLDTAKGMAREGVVVRGVPVTDELYDIILFLTHSFVRPVVSELYAIKHTDVTVAKSPKRLIVVNVTLSMLFKEIYETAGIRTSSHSGRRTFATRLNAKGVGMRTIHRKAATTALRRNEWLAMLPLGVIIEEWTDLFSNTLGQDDRSTFWPLGLMSAKFDFTANITIHGRNVSDRQRRDLPDS